MSELPGTLPGPDGALPIAADASGLFDDLFQLSPDPVLIHDGNTLLEINQAGATRFGFGSSADTVGLPIIDFVHPEDRDTVVQRVSAMLAAGQTEPLMPERLVTRAGAEIHGVIAAKPVTYQGRPAILAVIRDVTERDRAQATAAESEHNYRVLFDMSPDPSVVHDGELIVKANHAMSAFMGVDAEAAVGTSFWPMIREDSREAVRERVIEMATQGITREPLRVMLVRPDGAELVVETATAPLVFAEKPAFMTVFRDLTARINAEETAERYRLELEGLVAERTAKLAEVRTELDAIVAVVMRTVELRDPYTAGHQERVALLADAMAEQLGLPSIEPDRMAVAARRHDIGKVTVPAEILAKPGALGKAEHDLMKEHAQATADILLSVRLDWPLAEITRQHHERLDGSGYPDGLVGDEILPMARLLAVADVVEAMSSHRPYRPAVGVDAALAEITAGRDVLYDAEAVDACLGAFEAGFVFD
ncbi:MAG: PAS domain S-box protein [Coriobacteriia bacterium]|nr:PAS domain S-box protein [Coriobacteriia bacterium]